jgi:vancomycin permeability regulator SanA
MPAAEHRTEGPGTIQKAPAERRARCRYRQLLLFIVAATCVAGTLIAGSVGWTRAITAGYLYSADDAPAAPVTLVLGKLVYPDGTPSPLLRDRLELAYRLYETGKTRAILVSGDGGSRPGYDEVTPMRRWLVHRGVSGRRIVSDPRGFDTYDSCMRAKSVFGVDRAIVVTQTYHLPRAVALCRHVGIDAIGVGDDSGQSEGWSWWSGVVREQPASVRAIYDMLARSRPVAPNHRDPGLVEALRQD